MTERLQWSSGCVPRRSNSNREAGDPASTNSQIVHWRNYISKHNSLSVSLRTCKTLYNLNLVSVFSTWHWLNYSMPRKYAYLRIIRNTFAMRWQSTNLKYPSTHLPHLKCDSSWNYHCTRIHKFWNDKHSRSKLLWSVKNSPRTQIKAYLEVLIGPLAFLELLWERRETGSWLLLFWNK